MKNHLRKILALTIATLTSLSILIVGSFVVSADTASELQSKIDARNQDIKNLEKEIAGYQSQINDLNSQASSLSATIKSLDLTQKKLNADIAVTENRVAAEALLIQRLSGNIADKEESILDDKHIIGSSLANMHEIAGSSVPELLLSSGSITSAFKALDQLETMQTGLVTRIKSLEEAKTTLETNKKASEKAKADLVTLRNRLGDQRQAVLATVAEKNKLLKDTKASEAQYQSILAQKKKLKDAFETEVLNYESQLRLNVDASKIPHSGSGILSWPLDQITITQYFGNTDFATANPQVYNGKGHTGVDFRASIGTPVKAALSGVVAGIGNTDIVPTCYSYGKWIMVKHPNGLSTLYAHLSVQSVSIGQSISTGQVLGYSGNTGYSTGPHLHFGVYATDGVQITKLTNSKNCRGVTIPLADFKAYLNPLSYL